MILYLMFILGNDTKENILKNDADSHYYGDYFERSALNYFQYFRSHKTII